MASLAALFRDEAYTLLRWMLHNCALCRCQHVYVQATNGVSLWQCEHPQSLEPLELEVVSKLL